MKEKIIVEQDRTRSATWWVGMAACVAQSVCGILTATGAVTPVVSAAVIAGFSAIFAYCNGNNPSIKGNY